MIKRIEALCEAATPGPWWQDDKESLEVLCSDDIQHIPISELAVAEGRVESDMA
jgi:hypothetical protein